MGQLDSILDTTVVTDFDEPFVVDAKTREIKNPNKHNRILMQNDHESERISFEIPRFVEGRDLALCNVVQIYYINIDAKSRKDATGVYTVEDLKVYPYTTDILTCSWLVSQNATKYEGTLSFMLRFATVGDNGVVTYNWSTRPFKGIEIVESLDSAETFEFEYIDIIQQWKNSVMEELNLYVDETVKGHVNVGQIYINKDNILELIEAAEVLKARMNAFTALDAGSTTGDAELQDIRAGVNGIVYDTAGEAVREQISDVSKGVSTSDTFLNNQVRSYNKNNLDEAHIGYYLSTDDEVITMSESQGYSDYIPVKQGENYIARHPWGAQYSVSFYDEHKLLISQQSYTEDTPLDKANDSINTSYWHCITIPEGVEFIRTNFGTSNPLYTMVVEGSTVDEIPIEYVAYKAEILSGKFLEAVYEHVSESSGIVQTEENTRLGCGALPISDGVKENVAIGANALHSITVDIEKDDQSGRYNVAVGNKALQDSTTGNHNTSVGFQTMMGNTSGSANTAIGEDALMTNPEGSYNVVVGCRAMQSATAGDYNTAVGLGAAYWSDDLHPTGSRNTMVGAHSGQANGDGSDNVAIGYFAKASNGLHHTIAIGATSMATKDGQTMIGSANTVETIVRGDFIVMASDGTKRQIIFNADGSCSWTKISE